ncbi:MAG: PEGA domain-containing protein [Deltaproteobacteria bacterium]|nr:PEGA domain-containing protein [Deltaproteobacteria bacterium]
MRLSFSKVTNGVFLLLVLTVSARAQQPDSASSNQATIDRLESDSASEFSTVATSDASAEGGQLQSPANSPPGSDEQRKRDARQHEQFQRALPHLIKAEGLFENDIFEGALAEYRTASEILRGHTKHYQTLYNLGLCQERLFRYTEALRYYRAYLEAGGEQAEKRIEVIKLVDTLLGLLSTLRISVNINASVWIDGMLIGRAPGEFLVAGGRHTVELRAGGYESSQVDVRLPARSLRELSFTMKEIGSYHGIHPTYFWISAGVAVASVSVGGYFGIRALLKDDEAKNKYSHDKLKYIDLDKDELQQQLDNANEEIDDLKLKADIFFAVSGAFALSSVILFFLTDWSSHEKAASTPRSGRFFSLATRFSDSEVVGYVGGCFKTTSF